MQENALGISSWRDASNPQWWNTALEHLCSYFFKQSYSRHTAILWESQWNSLSSSSIDILACMSIFQQLSQCGSKSRSAEWFHWGNCIQIWWL